MENKDEMKEEKEKSREIVIMGKRITSVATRSSPFAIPLNGLQRKEIRQFIQSRTSSVSQRIRTIKSLTIDESKKGITDEFAQKQIDKLKLPVFLKKWNTNRKSMQETMKKINENYKESQSAIVEQMTDVLVKAELQHEIPYKMDRSDYSCDDIEQTDIIQISDVKSTIANQSWETKNQAKFTDYQLRIEQLEKMIEERILFGNLAEVEGLLKQYFTIGDKIDALDKTQPDKV